MTRSYHAHLMAALCVSLCGAAEAMANTPSQQAQQGGVGAGAATRDSAGSLFANPATITGLSHNQVHADLTLSWRTAGYTREVQGTERDTARLLSVDMQPNIAFSRQLADTGLFVSVGVGRGYLDRTHWLDEGGEQRWHSIYSGLRTWEVSPGAAYAISDRFSVGANLHLTRVHAYGYQAVDYGALVADQFNKEDIPAEAPGNEGRAHMDFKGNTGAFGLGATFSPGERTTLGVAFTSAATVDIAGEVSVYQPRNAFFATDYSDQENAPASLEMTLPRKLQLGVHHALSESLEVQADVELVQWSQLDAIVIDVAADTLGGITQPDRRLETSFKNVAAARVGVTRHTAPGKSMFFGLGYVSSPVASEDLSPAWLYGQTIDATLGARFKLDSSRRVGVSYTQRVMIPREVEQSNAPHAAAGKYTQYAGFLNLSVDWEIRNASLNLPEVQPASEGAQNL